MLNVNINPYPKGVTTFYEGCHTTHQNVNRHVNKMSARYKGKRLVTGKTILSIQTQVNDQIAVNNKSMIFIPGRLKISTP